MSFIRHILFLLTAMSTNPWSHGVASEIPQYRRQNLDQNYYELQDLHKVLYRSSNESKWLNNRNGQQEESSLIDRIVFPGPVKEYSRHSELDIPEECENFGFCESVLNYPNKEVTDLVSEQGDNMRIFQVDKLDVPDTPDIAQRLGPQEENMELCSSREKVVYPQAVRDTNGKWHVVINPKEKPVQGFRVETCEKNQSPCADFVSFQSGYEAQCIQKYVQRQAQTLDSSGKMVQVPFKLPSCCSCIAKLVIR